MMIGLWFVELDHLRVAGRVGPRLHGVQRSAKNIDESLGGLKVEDIVEATNEELTEETLMLRRLQIFEQSQGGT